MNRVGSVRLRFLFEPAPATSLAVIRILFFGWLFLWYFRDDFGLLSMGPPELWHPLFVLRVVGLDGIPSETSLIIVSAVWKAALLLACVGLATRIGIGVSLLFGAYLLALTHSFWKVNHSDGSLILAMAVLVFSRCGDRFSLDRLIRRARAGWRELPPPEDHVEYRWPVRLVQLIMVMVFFNSGVSKIVNGGLPWTAPENLYGQILQGQLTREPLLQVDLPYEPLKMLFTALSIGTVAFELAAPLALLSDGAALIIISSLFAMQVGIRLFMGDDFSQFASLYLFWVPWEKLARFWPIVPKG